MGRCYLRTIGAVRVEQSDVEAGRLPDDRADGAPKRAQQAWRGTVPDPAYGLASPTSNEQRAPMAVSDPWYRQAPPWNEAVLTVLPMTS